MTARRLVLLAAWLLVFAAPAAGDVRTDYFAVLINGKKVGHAVHARTAAEGKVTTADTLELTISRAGVAITMKQAETTVETADGKPLSFRCVQDLGVMAMRVEGTVSGGKLTATVTSAGKPQARELDWPEGALMSEGLSLLERKMGLKEGTKYEAKVFMASMLSAWPAQVRNGPTKQADLLGRVVDLTEVTVSVRTPTGAVDTTTYVDAEHRTQKSIVSVLGMNIEIVACSKEVALSPVEDVQDMLDAMILSSPRRLGDLKQARAITYTLRPTGKEKLIFLASPAQTVTTEADGRVTLTAQPAAAPSGAAFPYPGKDPDVLAALKPTAFLQSDRKEIVELARKAVGDATDAAQAAARIEKFVRQYINKKDLSVGYASAAEVAESRQGDCSEHAVLAAAMCRSVGIPAQVVVGVAYVDQWGQRQGIFGPHAWFRARMGQIWVDYDAALDGFDPGHIAIAAGDGNPEDFFALLNTLGGFRIEKVEVRK